MPELYIARAPKRLGLHLEMEGTAQNPNLMFFLPKMEKGQLDQFVRSELAKQGVTKESVINKIIEKAEEEYEKRIKIAEVKAEVKRLMEIRANGGKLMSVGFRKWKQAFYPAISKGG